MTAAFAGNDLSKTDSNSNGFGMKHSQGQSQVQHPSHTSVLESSLSKIATNITDPATQTLYHKEMENFLQLFKRFMEEKLSGVQLDWDKVKSADAQKILPYSKLETYPRDKIKNLLEKLVVLKLNGGLGTSMGCVGPKSAIEVRDGQTFLDLTVQQIAHLNKKYDVNVPLILMNSFNTDKETKRIIQKYADANVMILTFNQSCYPRILQDSLLPPSNIDPTDNKYWYPPGHGDIYESLANSGLLDSLMRDGKEVVFVSNIDNLGAIIDFPILHHMANSDVEFIMELTEKTKADVKGGTLIEYDGVIRLLEIAQVPPKYVDEFKSIKKFKYFNTNNLWISLPAIRRLIDQQQLRMEIIVNPKTIPETKEKVIQLETAVGAGIKHFRNALGINVPRSRFLPVKNCSDLFLIQSDLYCMNAGELVKNSKREFATVPIVELGDSFKNVNEFLERFKSPPQILELDHLTVSGDVTFGSNVQLKGTVIIVANHGSRIDIPSGAILDNKVVSGNLRILEI